jgi:ABC-type phosphate transport system substrate-binding protein
VKLTDILYSIFSQYRNVENFIRHPFEKVTQHGRRVAQDKLESFEVPIRKRDWRSPDVTQEQHSENGRSPISTPKSVAVTAPSNSLPLQNLPIAPQQTELPLLSEQEEIRGRWGKYRRVGGVIKSQPRVRWYHGTLALNNKPVLIKEYFLSSRDFSPSDIRERKEKFAFVSNLNLRSSGGQDFRLVNLYEAIASPDADENSCYLISEPIPDSQTLRESLTGTQTALTSKQVRHALNQVLQTLWFLHHQKIRNLNGEVQYSLPHGNLNLDSLLIGPTPLRDPAIDDELQFFIYVTDLALWEHLFIPVTNKPPIPTPAQDLIDLAYVGFYLLTGNPPTESRPNLLLDQPWTEITDQPLKQFIRQLVRGEFKADVEAARQVLIDLSWPQPSAETMPSVTPAHPPSPPQTRILQQLLALGLLGGCLIALPLGWQWWTERSRFSDSTQDGTCCLAKIDLPNKPITYVTEAGSIWDHVLRTPNRVAFNRSLEQILQERRSALKHYTLATVKGDALAAVQSGKADFALTQWRTELPQGLQQEKVANDGVVVLVAFGDARRTTNIPEAFKGEISMEQLRQLYTGTVRGWPVPENLKGWKIQRYRPTDQDAIAQFEQQVLKEPGAIAQFRKQPMPTLSTAQMLGAILQDFEQRRTIGLGFARLSQVINQCSVYPLAVGEQGQAVQPLAQNQGPAIDPTVDLCGDKGSYGPNVTAFNTETNLVQRSYPLRIPLAVVYRQNSQAGQQFAAALKTSEGQALLNAGGLVPLHKLVH